MSIERHTMKEYHLLDNDQQLIGISTTRDPEDVDLDACHTAARILAGEHVPDSEA